MARLGIVAFLIGLLLADPVLCRSVEAEGPCDGRCAAGPGVAADGHEPSPLDGCHDEAHDCACQGVTNAPHAGGKHEAPSATVIPWLLRPYPGLPASRAPSPSAITSPGDADGPPVGRSTRIAHRSFLI